MANIKWSKELCAEVALQYDTRGAFAKHKPSGAYLTAQRNKWLDDICGHMVKPAKVAKVIKTVKAKATKQFRWTPETIATEALKHKTRSAFCKAKPTAYIAARKFGIRNAVCAHMVDGKLKKARGLVSPKRISDEEVVARAAKYKTKADLYRGDSVAYSAVYERKLQSLAFAHMDKRAASTRDTLYVWEALGESYNGKRVYKIGITSGHIKKQRVLQVAKRNLMQAKVVAMRWVGDWYAHTLEQHLLSFGEDPQLDVPDGRTEFRALTDEELQAIIKIIESHFVL